MDSTNDREKLPFSAQLISFYRIIIPKLCEIDEPIFRLTKNMLDSIGQMNVKMHLIK